MEKIMEKNFMELQMIKGEKIFNLTTNMFSLINSLSNKKEDKWELLCFAYEFITNGKLIDVGEINDKAVDVLYPVCRSIRISN
jgi:hypothetical protein